MNNIELKDFDYKVSKRHAASRKIKFKNISFFNFSNKFRNFLISRLEKKLEKATEEVVNSKFSEREMNTKIDDKSLAERIMKYRTEKIAKLEEKIIILGRGKIEKRNYVNSRAIKLKNEMMKYVIKTGVDIYSIPEEIKENILNDKSEDVTNDTKRVIDEETNKLQNYLKNNENNIREEEINAAINQSLNNISLENDLDPKESQESVNKIFENKELEEQNMTSLKNEYEFNEENLITPIKNITPKEFPEISPATIINQKLSEINLNDDIFGNASKINVDDVTKDNIKNEENNDSKTLEREMPIVAEDRDNVDYLEKAKNDIRKYDSLMENLKQTAIEDVETAEKIKQELEKTENDIIDSKNNLTDEEAIKLEEEFENDVQDKNHAEESEDKISFDYSEATANDIDKAIKVTKSPKDLKAMMERVKILQEEERRTQERAEKAEKEKQAKEQEFEETAKKLQAYGDDLEQRCTQNAEKEKQTLQEAKEWDNAINSMLQAMNNPISNNIKKK